MKDTLDAEIASITQNGIALFSFGYVDPIKQRKNEISNRLWLVSGGLH